MQAKHIKLQYPEEETEMEIVLKVNRTKQNIQKVMDLKEITEKGKALKVDIKQYRQKRSLDANSFCWIIAQKIAEAIGNTKEFVYKQAIKQVGQFEIVPIRDDVVEKWIQAWESKGLGWQAEVMEKSKLEGYTKVINYFGSSIYDTKQMSLLINEIVFQAKELGIETITEEEKQALLATYESEIKKGE